MGLRVDLVRLGQAVNELAVEMCLDPKPFKHMVVRRQHPKVDEYRFSCLCGWWSEWIPEGAAHWPDHPDGLFTVSRSDWTVIPHPSQVQS